MSDTSDKTRRCEDCGFRSKAEANPKSFLGRLWHWHTKFCPGWKSYQKHLATQGEQNAEA